MRSFAARLVWFATVFAALALNAGCGGSSLFSGLNSAIEIKLTRTDGTQVMTNYELYMTKEGDTGLDTADPEDFASTLNQPSWCDDYTASRSATELNLRFTTRSGQPPYFLFVRVPNTGAAFETLRLQINVDDTDGDQKTYDLTIDATERLTSVRIERNSAIY